MAKTEVMPNLEKEFKEEVDNMIMVELENMSVDQLRQVSDFRVWNEHGSVEFLGQTDVTGVDLGDVITLGAVEVVARFLDARDNILLGERKVGSTPRVFLAGVVIMGFVLE